MSDPVCRAAVFLRSGGPAQVPFEPCCAAALLHVARAPELSPPPCPRAELLGALLALAPVPVGEVVP
jgi:hypothetical protein